FLLYLVTLCPSRSTLFPYTTLFRSLFNFTVVITILIVTWLTVERIRYSILFSSCVIFPCHVLVPLFPFAIILSTFIPLSVNSAKDRKSTRLNSSHVAISYAVFCLKK